MLRRCALVFLFLVVLALPAGANGRTTEVAFGWAVAYLPGGQEWIRFTNTDDATPIRLASVHGLSFNITSVVSVRASGAQTPSCTVSTAPTSFDYLYCNGELPPIRRCSSSSARAAAATTSRSPRPTRSTRARSNTRPTPISVRSFLSRPGLTKTPTTEQVSFTSGGHAYDEIEILPHGFTITKVNSIAPAGSECDLEGPGLDCTVALPANATGTVTFETSGATSGTPTADVIMSGEDGSGNAFVTQTQGPAATYDLLTKARPSVVTYKRGQKLATHPIRFTVTNAGNATIASSPPSSPRRSRETRQSSSAPDCRASPRSARRPHSNRASPRPHAPSPSHRHARSRERQASSP